MWNYNEILKLWLRSKFPSLLLSLVSQGLVLTSWTSTMSSSVPSSCPISCGVYMILDLKTDWKKIMKLGVRSSGSGFRQTLAPVQSLRLPACGTLSLSIIIPKMGIGTSPSRLLQGLAQCWSLELKEPSTVSGSWKASNKYLLNRKKTHEWSLKK